MDTIAVIVLIAVGGLAVALREVGGAAVFDTLVTLLLVVGTSGAVWPAAGLALRARADGTRVAIVNPHPSDIDDAAHDLVRGTAAAVLPALLAP